MEITAKQQKMLDRVYELARKEIETSDQRLNGAPQWDDADLVEHAFAVALTKMQDELMFSHSDKARELKEMEENATKAWAAHEEEANRAGAEFYNLGWSSGDAGDWFGITSKTSLGRFWTGRHGKTGEVKHTWLDE
jgi:hypothetical protein